jgi:outer membrane protein assembly factor BamB
MNALRFVPLLAVAVLAAFVKPVPAAADTVPFASYSVDEQGAVISLNPAYLPVRLLGNDLPLKADGRPDTFKNPEDVFVDGQDRIYIADRGNDRIVQLDENGAFSRYIGHLPGKGKLKAPEGVFVDRTGSIYVADTGNSRIVRYSPEGEPLRDYTAPDSAYLPKDYRFVPSKLVVDSRDNLYVVSKGSYQGMLQLGQNNEFLSFYGKNRVKLSPVDRLQRLFYTKEQRERLSDVLPGSITNVTINAQGFLYTTTMSIDTEQIKKLNYAGQNILPEKEFFVPRPSKSGPAVTSYMFRDVAVGAQGMITAIDAKTNTILQYDAQGKLLYTFEGEDDRVLRIGKLKSPSGLALTSEGDLLVTDNTTNLVHLLRPTPFSKLVLEATSLYAEGKYEQSEEPWNRVLQLNESYSRAHLGLAKLSFKRGDWDVSMAEYKQALDGQGYSDAFWQVRMLWLQKRFTLIAVSLVSLAAAWWLVRRALARRLPVAAASEGARLPGLSRFGVASVGREAVRFGSVLKRPLAVFEELRDGKTGSWTFGFLVLAGILLSRLGEAWFTGFVFHPVPAHLADPLRIGAVLLVPLLSWVLCNYLVSTLYRGEGTFKDVFVGTMYALAPYALFTLPLALFSNGLTASEGVIYHFVQKAVLVWTALLLIIKVQLIHNYDVKETAVNVLLTLATIVVLWFAIFVHVTLSFDLRDFVAKLWEELIYRG